MSFCSSCGPKYDITKEELLGEWRTTEMFINDDDSEIPFHTNGLVIMGLNDDHYFYNFDSGQWYIEKDQLTLEREDEIFRDYSVIFFNGDSLVVETKLTEDRLFFDIESIEQDEVFTLREHYRKQ